MTAGAWLQTQHCGLLSLCPLGHVLLLFSSLGEAIVVLQDSGSRLGGQGQPGGFCPCAQNKMPPVVSTEGVSSERLLSTPDCLIVVVAAQETMFVFLRTLPTPREKPNAK